VNVEFRRFLHDNHRITFRKSSQTIKYFINISTTATISKKKSGFDSNTVCLAEFLVKADEKYLFRICVNRRDLRASPDSVAAGRAVVFVAK
jgi:hypothetical protein